MAEIARGVIDRGFKDVIVFSAPDDRSRGTETVRLAGTPFVQAASRTSNFVEFAEQVASCEYLITVDTSITQIAAAMGIPMILLLRSEIDQFPWLPLGIPYEVYRQKPDLTTLEPEPVLALFGRLLERTSAAVTVPEEDQ
jgi:ADP-heptose:LPS heptosyltransferase